MTIQYHSSLFKTLKDPQGQNNYIPYKTIPDQTKPYVKLELVPFKEGHCNGGIVHSYKLFKGQTLPNGPKRGQTGSKGAKRGQMGLNRAKQGQLWTNGAEQGKLWPNGVKQCITGPNGAKRVQTGPNWAKWGQTWTTQAKWCQTEPNLGLVGDHP